MIYMAFDYGWSSWGCAVGDDLTGASQAVRALASKCGIPNWDEVDQLLSTWRVEALVIGYPLKVDGSRFKLTDQVDHVILALEQRYSHLPIHRADERLSTISARENLYAAKGKRGLEKGAVDAESARIILEQWLESNLL